MGAKSSKISQLRKLPNKVSNPSKIFTQDPLTPVNSLPSNRDAFSRDRNKEVHDFIPPHEEKNNSEMLFKNLKKFSKPQETTSNESKKISGTQENLISILKNRQVLEEEEKLADESLSYRASPPKLGSGVLPTLRTADLGDLVKLGHLQPLKWTPAELSKHYGLPVSTVNRILAYLKPCTESQEKEIKKDQDFQKSIGF
ncbi:hypothetical protein DSO57_1023140 [Entomophthora muscae]|uniref:Uncharacterized protein n=1 Tax=Entomophthora muscae TaxID=34485 RepID=A0ACC2RHQ9_9FUNG|nr:hypothetical protein DSO57_1023140 [Entomophthora muscae]